MRADLGETVHQANTWLTRVENISTTVVAANSASLKRQCLKQLLRLTLIKKTCLGAKRG